MESGNTKALPPPESELKTKRKGKLYWFLNIFTFGIWGKLTPRERGVAFTSWNVSSWFTFGQVAGAAWLWKKATLAFPWLSPFVKSAWAKVVMVATVTRQAIESAV